MTAVATVRGEVDSATLGRVLDVENPTSAIVFCRTRTEVDELTESLNGRGYRAEALHGGLSQEQRDRVMKRVPVDMAAVMATTSVCSSRRTWRRVDSTSSTCRTS